MRIPHYYTEMMYKELTKRWGMLAFSNVESIFESWRLGTYGENLELVFAEMESTDSWERLCTTLAHKAYEYSYYSAGERDSDLMIEIGLIGQWGRLLTLDPRGDALSRALNRAIPDGFSFKTPKHAYKLIHRYAMLDFLETLKNCVERVKAEEEQNK